MASHSQGKQPKSQEEMRSKLLSMRTSTSQEHTPGPHINGIDEEFPILIASFYDPVLARKFQHELGNLDIYTETKNRSRQVLVYADAADATQANLALAKFQERHTDQRPIRNAARWDALIFGSIIGFTLAVVMSIGARQSPYVFAFVIAVTILGMIIGHLIDRTRVHVHRYGSAKTGVWELICLCSIPAIIYWIGALFPGLFK